MSTTANYILLILNVFLIYLLLLSFYKIRKNKKQVGFIYSWGFIFGAFCWEDLFTFSLIYIVAVNVSLLFKDARLVLLFFFIFWIVRSMGETIYYFLQQFTKPTFHPHNISKHFVYIRKFFGEISDQKCFILIQVFTQMITMVAISGFVYVIFNWSKLQGI